MKLTITKVKFSEFDSDDSNCFNLILCSDGKPVCEVSNSGHGGPDNVRVINKPLYDETVKFIELMPPINSHGISLDMDMELYVGELFDKWLSTKELTKMMKKKIVFIKNGNIHSIKLVVGAEFAQRHVQMVKDKFGATHVLNGLPLDEAVDIFTKAANGELVG